MQISQKEFDEFVQSFNEDYLELLKLAAARDGSFEVLVESFVRLKDLYEVITVMREAYDMEFKTELLPFSLSNKNDLLKSFGFTRREIRRIKKFFKKFCSLMECDFQELMLSKAVDRKKRGEAHKAFIKSSSTENLRIGPATA